MSTTACDKKPARLGLVLVFLGVLGVLSYRATDRLIDTSTQIGRSYQILAKLDALSREVAALRTRYN